LRGREIGCWSKPPRARANGSAATVGHTRVWADVEALHDRSADLTRLGIDEIS